VELPAKTSSYQQWSESLVEYGRTADAQSEFTYWMNAAPRSVAAIPQDHCLGENTEESAARVLVELSETETKRLVQEVPKAHGIELQHALIGALVQVVTEWRGDDGLLLDLEGHGREEEIADLNLSRTVGWFTSIYPVWFPRIASTSIFPHLESVRARLKSIPWRGIGYGILRYQNSDSTDARLLAQAPAAEIGFNYLGQLDRAAQEEGVFRRATRSEGPSKNAKQRREWQLQINCWIRGGRFQANWSYSRNLHRADTIQTLANKYLLALGLLISESDANSTQMPDFEIGVPGLDAGELDSILGRIRIGSADHAS
jgi:non-ribosomal peptide synthase protein (TIGR01720 family)